MKWDHLYTVPAATVCWALTRCQGLTKCFIYDALLQLHNHLVKLDIWSVTGHMRSSQYVGVVITWFCFYRDMVLGGLCQVTAMNAHMQWCWAGPSRCCLCPILSLEKIPPLQSEVLLPVSSPCRGFLLSWSKELVFPSSISVSTDVGRREGKKNFQKMH